jgi:hypothetical protein
MDCCCVPSHRDPNQGASGHANSAHTHPRPPAPRRCLPHLKTSVRGAGWEDAHWAQLFALLGFKPGSLTRETVTLAHFLDKAAELAAAAEAIRALDAQVRGAGGGLKVFGGRGLQLPRH